MNAAHKLSLAVQYACDAQIMPTRAQLRRWVKSALQRDVRMTLRIVDEAEGRELNKKYRGKDYATNVLTFVYDDEQTPPGLPLSGEEILCGDVVICAPVVEREAAAQHKELLAHYAHLAIHAALHLQGHDHLNDIDAAEMEALETALMLKLHYPDPYQTTHITNG
ncbi:MAG: rRNA maturation RNase YbeY [Nitrosomonadales bacterium]|nr:rRNA maturation RNase YbeY [Nitrosomonadales bacterium]